MPTYTGPVPPTPTGSSTDAAWQSWWTYQTILQNMRYEDERAARAIVVDRQHAEKMAAEGACAAAVTKQAEAQVKATEAMLRIHTTPSAPEPVSDEQLVRHFMLSMADTTDNPAEVLGRAKVFVRLLRLAFQPT